MRSLLFVMMFGLGSSLATATEPQTRTGELRIPADATTSNVPETYRLAEQVVPFEVRFKHDLAYSQVEVFTVTFPSPVKSEHTVNNTVYCEYFRPKGGSGKRPAAIVLDILDGAGVVSRGEAMWLALNDIPSLCMTMPYYGPRRPDDKTFGKQRFLSADVNTSKANIHQCILDARVAVAWLAEQAEGGTRANSPWSAPAWAVSWAAYWPLPNRVLKAPAYFSAAGAWWMPLLAIRKQGSCSRR